MKKTRIFLILFIGLFALSGCNTGFCSISDLEAIKEKIRIENIESLEAEALELGLEGQAKEEFIDERVSEKMERDQRRACMTLSGEVIYENPEEGIILEIEPKNWGFAFEEGLFQGLLVFPVSVMLIFFTEIFGAGGYGQIFSIIVVTIILRLLTLLLTLKSSFQTHKMQSLQPEIAEIQNKMKEAKDPMTKQKYGMQMMEIYKKNNINPLSSIIMPFVSLPIFIAIWRAVLSTYTLREGAIYGLELGVNMNVQILDFSLVAISLFIVMCISQFISMKAPLWLAERDKNKEQTKNQMGTFANVMFILIIVISFALPAAMIIYWTVGALFGIGQTFLLRHINKKRENDGTKIEKTKVIK